MKTMHLFAGAGGGLLADLILGHDPIIAVEWDGYACQVLRERAADGWFPNLQVWEGDVRMFDPSEFDIGVGEIDAVVGGFPCQDLSIAGEKAGLGDGTRSGLYRELLRIVGSIRPKYIFLENVSAILSGGLECVLADLAAMGFSARWCCLRASDVGATHARDRWWLLAYSGSEGLEGGKRLRVNNEKNVIRKTSANGPVAEFCTNDGRKADPWNAQSSVRRVADDVPHRVHRLKALGNAQVPLQAAVAWKLLGGP